MSEPARHPDPHIAVQRDVLVRYLDVWTAAALRSQRGATYVSAAGGHFAGDAFRVFGEFVDRLAGHHLDVVIVGASADVGEPPAGLSVRVVADTEDVPVSGPTLAHLDGGSEAAWRLVASLGHGKGREVVVTSRTVGTDYRERLRAAGFSRTLAVELVADDDQAQLLAFATDTDRHLETFKNELWAVDEFAGIRYRDPHDAERTLVDISLTPQLLPLRRMLLAELARRGRCTVADLQRHTLLETIYRPADTVGAVTSAVAAGDIAREPEKGRLTPRTLVSAVP
ncbi:MAG TPA: hypothetical protein VHC18_09330 [Amycolatopsis sp.]|nr:hypothetical protein [Amycolatopsis sp.]